MLLEWDEEEVYWSESIHEDWKMEKKHESPLMDQNHMEAEKSEKEDTCLLIPSKVCKRQIELE